MPSLRERLQSLRVPEVLKEFAQIPGYDLQKRIGELARKIEERVMKEIVPFPSGFCEECAKPSKLPLCDECLNDLHHL